MNLNFHHYFNFLFLVRMQKKNKRKRNINFHRESNKHGEIDRENMFMFKGLIHKAATNNRRTE